MNIEEEEPKRLCDLKRLEEEKEPKRLCDV
jgi:hypothetical protein